jgi:hypothetical protein
MNVVHHVVFINVGIKLTSLGSRQHTVCHSKDADTNITHLGHCNIKLKAAHKIINIQNYRFIT